ncbi:MAG: HlyD family efflux transporter periplasmic adaptor subunit [Bdellovibrionaceae bacterium]|nr:HlyD family efflux transporter periplasmic adaptor subunit [Pseudobdellovibrionaceae bacterium]NUM57364.1 HlyD family efflux transporter periplasmic adaptor subunit [Pseudobdellovibrionaceae bacterium]
MDVIKGIKKIQKVLFIFLIFSEFSTAMTKKPEVVVELAQLKEVEKMITFPAMTKSQKQSVILAENSGILKKTIKQLGQEIKRNEVIAWIENPDPIYQYKPFAVRSPIAGRLTKVQVLEGSSIEKGMTLFTVTDPKSVVIEVQVPAKDVSSLKIGSKAFFITDGKREVKLVGLSPSPDLGTLTSQALFEFTDKKEKPTSGIQGYIEYMASAKKMILLPESNLLRKNGKVFIRKIYEGKMKLVELKVGDRYEDQLEVVNGIASGEEYISRTSQHVKDGEEVIRSSVKNHEIPN